jgi:hypothetical protein
LLLIYGTTPEQQQTWPVATLISVTFVAEVLGFFVLFMQGIALERHWRARILSTIGVVVAFLFIGYFTLLEPRLPLSIHRLDPALNGLLTVALLCLVLGDVVASRARRRASR